MSGCEYIKDTLFEIGFKFFCVRYLKAYWRLDCVKFFWTHSYYLISLVSGTLGYMKINIRKRRAYIQNNIWKMFRNNIWKSSCLCSESCVEDLFMVLSRRSRSNIVERGVQLNPMCTRCMIKRGDCYWACVLQVSLWLASLDITPLFI